MRIPSVIRLPAPSLLLALGLLALLCGLLPGASRAADPDPAVDPDADREKSEEELEEQSLRHEVIEWESWQRVIPGPRLLDPRAWSFDWREGIELSREDGALRFRLGGRYLGDAAGFHLDDDFGGRVGSTGWDGDFTTRQARPYLQGVFLDRFFVATAYEAKNSDAIDFFFGVRGRGPLGTLQFGYMREPFSLELRTSFLTQTLMERSLAQALSPDRNYGVLLTNTHLDRRLRWSAGVFYVVDEFGGFDDVLDSDDAVDLVIRVNGLPIRTKEGRRFLLVGFSYNHRFNVQDDVSFKTRPESFLVDPLVDTGAIAGASDYDRWGLEAAWVDGPFSVQAELIGLHVRRSSGSDVFFSGGYAQASYFLTGERRVYGRRSGSFGRVVPRRSFNPSKGRWGAFELAARVSYLDLDDADVRGGRQFNTALGVNWYLHAHVRLEANYVLAWVRNDGLANILQARIQLDY
jgi:phosphate-selective porin OprO/OprP